MPNGRSKSSTIILEGDAILRNPFATAARRFEDSRLALARMLAALDQTREREAQDGEGEGTPRQPHELVLAGADPLAAPGILALIREAREAGVDRVRLRSDASRLAADVDPEALASAGATSLELPMIASNVVGYALLSRHPKGLAFVLAGLRRALDAGLQVDVEAPLVDPRVQDPVALVSLLERVRRKVTAPDRESRLTLSLVTPENGYGYSGQQGLRPARLSDMIRGLDEASGQARRAQLPLQIPEYSGIPPCLVRDAVEARAAITFGQRRRRSTRSGFRHDSGCDACAYRGVCSGLRERYVERFGTGELSPLVKRLRDMSGRRSRDARSRWTAEAIAHARSSDMKVLRLTMRCNQRCVFCPSDDSSENIVEDTTTRLKQLSRWYRHGVRRLSISGGEPTLAPDLDRVVEGARRIGFPIVEVVTNGVRFADPICLARLLDAGMNQSTVSLHAHEASSSQAITCGPPDDFERTLRGLDELCRSGRAFVFINHVIHAGTYAALPDFVRFVAERYRGVPTITFAYMTPLFRAYELPELLPAYHDVRPSLVRALDLAARLDQRVEVLSRPGIPPCILAPGHLAYSDLARVEHQSASEDRHKKTKAPSCASCHFDASCAGVWKAYAVLHGLEDLRPVTEPALS